MVSSQQYEALHRGAGLVDRSARGRLWLTGADRLGFLQGLLTNDVASLTPGTGCYAALLTAAGRMVTDMRVVELGDGLLIEVEPGLDGLLFERLDNSIFAEDVQVRNVTLERAAVGVYGPAAAGVIARAAADSGVSGRLDALAEHGSLRSEIAGVPALVVRSADPGVSGFDVVVPAEARERVAGAMREAGAIDVDPAVAEVCRIEAGRPRFTVDMNEDTIPLEAGIESRAISLTKGCYVGQEIIIRVLHRGGGRVARRLVGIALSPDAPVPERDAPVRAGERVAGAVTSAAWSPALERPIALAILHRDFTEPGTQVSIGPADQGSPAEVRALPFVAAAPLPA